MSAGKECALRFGSVQVSRVEKGGTPHDGADEVAAKGLEAQIASQLQRCDREMDVRSMER